jgi:hypothetical protein
VPALGEEEAVESGENDDRKELPPVAAVVLVGVAGALFCPNNQQEAKIKIFRRMKPKVCRPFQVKITRQLSMAQAFSYLTIILAGNKESGVCV